MKKFIVLFMSLIFVLGSCMALAGCSGAKSQEGVLRIVYFKGGYGDEWLKDSIKKFYAQKKGVDVSQVKEGVDYVLEENGLELAGNQGNLANSSDAPDIIMVHGDYEQYIDKGWIENLDWVYEQEVQTSSGVKKIKDYMLPDVYSSITRPMKYGQTNSHSWVMPWCATAFSLAYNETLLLNTVHHDTNGTVDGVADGEKWDKTPETVMELLAYFGDVNDGEASKPANERVVPFGWSENEESSLHLQFLIETWWAQIQGTTTAKISGEGTYYDFYNFNNLDLLNQTGIKNGFDTLRSLIMDNYGTSSYSYKNSDLDSNGNVASRSLSNYNISAKNSRYAVWVAGDYFENEYLINPATGEKQDGAVNAKLMTLPMSQFATGSVEDNKLTYIRTDEAWYIPVKALNKDLAKEFLVFMCQESELLNYTEKSGGIRPFDYNPKALAPDYDWTPFQESLFDIYQNERFVTYPKTTESNVSPIYLYSRGQVHFYMNTPFSSLITRAYHSKSTDSIMATIKTNITSQFNNWHDIDYKQYFQRLDAGI